MTMTTLRLRTRVADDQVADLAGKVPTDAAYDLLLTGATLVLKADSRPLCVYLPGYLAEPLALHPATYDVLRSLDGYDRTDNRGLAAGAPRQQVGDQKRTRTPKVRSGIAGVMGPVPAAPYCRLTAWTAQNYAGWEQLQPLLALVADALAEHVPERYSRQVAEARRCQPEWLVPGTPFTTVTVNNTYSTGVHTDKGDLAAGFSTLAVLRRGAYTGGRIVFPQHRVAADMRNGDLLLMDAHEWHGNTQLRAAHQPGCPHPPIWRTAHHLGGVVPDRRRTPGCRGCQAERISLVAYFRTAVPDCDTADAEAAKAARHSQKRTAQEAAHADS